MWLHKPPEYTIPTLVVHPEHISDRLREGWTECPDPTAAPVAAPAAQPQAAESAPSAAAVRKGRR